MPSYVSQIILLCAGIGVFLVAMKMTSDSMEKLSGNRMKKLLNKVSGKPVTGVGIGAAVTAIIQSSSATTVMVVGFVNAGILTLLQAAYIIMGANIGTTITAQIVQLQSYSGTEILMLLAFIGTFILIISKNDKRRTVGSFIAGLGLIFVGLWIMSASMKDLRTNPVFVDIVTSVSNPFLLLLFGTVLTAIIQSSSAMTTILLTMVANGVVIGGGGNAVLFIVLGSNIGTCITAILASFGTNANAHRAALIHLMFNVFGATVFAAFLMLYKNFTADVLAKLFPQPVTQLAMFHTFFNVATTLMLLPLARILVRISKFFVHDDKSVEELRLKFIDDRLLSTPAIALDQLIKEVARIASGARTALSVSIKGFIESDESGKEEVARQEIKVNYLVNECTKYLVALNTYDMNEKDEIMSSSMHHIIADFSRICDLACNIMRYTGDAKKRDLKFSNAVHEELTPMHETIEKMFDLVLKDMLARSKSNIAGTQQFEDAIDVMRNKFVDAHISRMNKGECNVESGSYYVNTLNNLERAADHLMFIEQYPK